MPFITALLIVLGIACELAATFSWPTPPRVNLQALGLAFFMASFIIAAVVLK